MTSTGAATLGGSLMLSGPAVARWWSYWLTALETGQFTTVSGLPAGYTLQYRAHGTGLVSAPEPSTFVLLIAAGLGVLAWRRNCGPRQRR